MELFDRCLDEYADLLVRVGVNIQKGQTLVLSCPVACADFGRRCARAAYAAGCGEVVMNWKDDTLARYKYLYAKDEVFDITPQWEQDFYNNYAKEGAAYLVIAATDPLNLAGVDPDRMTRATRSRGRDLAPFYERQMNDSFTWCIGSVPIAAWSKKVFPSLSEADADAALWQAIFRAVRVEGDGGAPARWAAHAARLAERTEILNRYRFVSLHYESELGTDYTVSLPEGHIWQGGAENCRAGYPFIANIPTEEIFTAPDCRTGNGVLCASRPLVYHGNIIRDLRFEVQDGRIIRATASEGEDILRAAIAVDDGGARFGELALVPYDSPISNENLLFFETLFDENAACHIAFGEAYPCLEGGADMSKAELAAHGLNDSITHVDFMIGTPDLSITGKTADGREIPVFRHGNFAF